MKLRPQVPIVLLLILGACRSDEKSDAEFEGEVVASMHELLLSQVRGLHQAAVDLQAAAPMPAGQGWSTSDQPAIDAMKAAWVRARKEWEPAEGVLAPLFPSIDQPLDSRYEDFMRTLGAPGDPNPFDGQGVTGMHAIERILFAPETPEDVVVQESSLIGYKAAAWPATEGEAADFKNGLSAQLVIDSQRLVDAWEPTAIDLRFAFRGLTSLMNEQEEKVNLAAHHAEESRYAQRTLADLRDNLAGTRAVYALFVPWLGTKAYGATTNKDVQLAFDRLDQTYADTSAVSGDAIPSPPPTWDSTLPSPDDQQSPFGQLYVHVVQEVDATRTGSAVDAMNHVARLLGLAEFTGD